MAMVIMVVYFLPSLLVSQLNNAFFTRQIFSMIFEWLSLTSQFASITFQHGCFFNTDVSQGSLATCLRCDGIFKYDFIANFLLSLTVKEFLKIA